MELKSYLCSVIIKQHTIMKKLIYSNELTEELLQDVADFFNEEISEEGDVYTTECQAVIDRAHERLQMDWQDESENLDIPLDGKIIVLCDMGLWNGRKKGYKVIEKNNVNGIFSVGYDNQFEIFGDTKDRNIKAINHHHDGTNYYTFRELKAGMNHEGFLDKLFYRVATPQDITRHTKSLYPKVKEVYGW